MCTESLVVTLLSHISSVTIFSELNASSQYCLVDQSTAVILICFFGNNPSGSVQRCLPLIITTNLKLLITATANLTTYFT